MDVLTLTLLVAALVLPFHWAVILGVARWESPEFFRRFGVIVRRPEALDAQSETIGRYLDAPIPRTVTFKGMEYDFAGIVAPRYQARIDENELYLDPGLLYVHRRPAAPALRGARLAGGHD